jgi:hypothetical protein
MQQDQRYAVLQWLWVLQTKILQEMKFDPLMMKVLLMRRIRLVIPGW